MEIQEWHKCQARKLLAQMPKKLDDAIIVLALMQELMEALNAGPIQVLPAIIA